MVSSVHHTLAPPPTTSRHDSPSQSRDCRTAPNLGMHASWPLARAAAADTVIKINAKIDNCRCSTVNSHNFICISDTASCSETRIESRALSLYTGCFLTVCKDIQKGLKGKNWCWHGRAKKYIFKIDKRRVSSCLQFLMCTCGMPSFVGTVAGINQNCKRVESPRLPPALHYFN